MKRTLHNLAMLGLVPVLSSVAVGGTHTINAKKAGIVKLFAISNQSQCTGSVIGVRPLTVLTAFHCISHIETGDVMVGIENEKAEMKKYPLQYMSTKAIVAPAFAGYKEFAVLKMVDADRYKAIADVEAKQAAVKLDPTSEEQKAKLRAAQQMVYQLSAVYRQGMQQLLAGATAEDSSSDLAILVFDRYVGVLNQRDNKELIADGSVIPLSPNKNLQGRKVAFGGFGMTGEAQRSASEEIGAFTNVVQKQQGNLLATYGMLPGMNDGRIARGNMGAVLPGDSGGPLMNDYGIVGVASYIKRDPMETTVEPAIGWPMDRDGFYSYLTGRFVDVSSARASELFAVAEVSYKLQLEENYTDNLDITDLASWGQPQSKSGLMDTPPAPVFLSSL